MTHHLILGGARSGKSRFAEKCALALSNKPIYLATGTAQDTEMQNRISRHQTDRASSQKNWALIEEPLDIARSIESPSQQSVILIDCLTMWLSNCLSLESGWDIWQTNKEAFLETIKSSHHDLIFVSNEVGMGIIPMGQLSRQFVDEICLLYTF